MVEAVNVNLLSFDGRRASICIIVDNDSKQLGYLYTLISGALEYSV